MIHKNRGQLHKHGEKIAKQIILHDICFKLDLSVGVFELSAQCAMLADDSQ
jgi:hypothetical protein